MMAHPLNPSTRVGQGSGSEIQEQPGPYGETKFINKQTNKNPIYKI